VQKIIFLIIIIYIYIRNQGRYDDNPHQKMTYDSGGDGEYDDDDNGSEDDD